jgi:hypothetical protein
MKEDLSLFERLHHGLCQAIEHGGVICFGVVHCKSLCLKHYCRVKKYNSVNLPKKETKICKFIDCENNHYGKGYCRKHYKSYCSVPKNKTKKCSVKDCDNHRTDTKIYCAMHYGRICRHGTPEGSGNTAGYETRFKLGHKSFRKKVLKTCIVPNCNMNSEDKKITKGLCGKHYQRWHRHGDYNIKHHKDVTHASNSKQMGAKRTQETPNGNSACFPI